VTVVLCQPKIEISSKIGLHYKCRLNPHGSSTTEEKFTKKTRKYGALWRNKGFDAVGQIMYLALK